MSQSSGARLADAEVAHMLESLMDVAQRAGIVKLQTGPSDSALRHARGWARRKRDTRIVTLTAAGGHALRQHFGVR